MAIFVQNFKIICRANYGKIREFTTIIIFMILPQKFRLEKSTIEKISEFNLFIGGVTLEHPFKSSEMEDIA